MTRKLVSLHVSPWSERAKWALDHHGIAYQVVEHLPIVGERRLRRLVGPGKPRATVPVLIDDGQVLSESWDIAIHADRIGAGSKLVPPEQEPAIRAWIERADAAMQSGRALIMARLHASPGALDEAAPPFVPKWGRPLFRPVARWATGAFIRKYGSKVDATQENTRALRTVLDALRAAVKPGTTYLLGSFTYADIVMATLLQGIAPVDDRFIRLGPETRKAWTNDDVAREYADVIAWRNGLYDEERKRRPAG
jgi:glutathione S-transferase